MANGSQNLTSYQANKWTNLRAFTIGGTSKDVDGTAAVSWSATEILGSSDSTKFYRGDKTWSDTLTAGLNAAYIGITNTNSTIGYGLSLYGGASAGAPTYGIFFGGTATFGTHGSVTSDQATYFTMNNDTSRGWIFRCGSTNVASISGDGAVQLNGALTLSGDINLKTSSADSPDITWMYGDTNTEQARIWMGSGGTSKWAPYYRCYDSSGTQLYSGNLVLGDGTSASGTWGISITGNADTVDSWHRDDIRKGCLSFTRNISNANPANLNNLNDGMAYNYGSGGYWQHAPSSPTYGSCIALTSGGSVALGGQFYWDINHNSSSSTRSLWFRAANNLGWQDDWKQIVWNSGTWGISVTGSSGSCTGNAATATTASSCSGNSATASKVGSSDMYLYSHYSNEINFGGSNGSGTIYFSYRAMDSKPIISSFVFGGSGGSATLTAGKVKNAVWNDFAEFRESDINEPGRVLVSNGKGQMILAQQRLVAGAKIITDTYGCSVGESDTQKTPLGVAGRVLAFTYRNRNDYNVGDCVCSAPNGTVDIMTRKEIQEYPDRIIGIVDEIPTYERWQQYQTSEKEGEIPVTAKLADIKVKGRIWIYVR